MPRGSRLVRAMGMTNSVDVDLDLFFHLTIPDHVLASFSVGSCEFVENLRRIAVDDGDSVLASVSIHPRSQKAMDF